MTKGGLPLYKQTPNTGPEFAFGFVALQALIGGIGYAIKKRST